ncbi:MAG: Spy/CpxP family protein refolding chaperone [Vicinamibacteria bacterium]
MRFKSALATVVPAVLVSLAVTYGVHAYRTPVQATSDDPFDVLNLSADQRQQIHAIAMAHHPSLIAGQAAVDAKRQELAQLLAAKGALDDAAVAKTLQDVSRLESELDQEVARNLVELRPLLTEKQQRTLFQHIELRHPRNPRPNGGRP